MFLRLNHPNKTVDCKRDVRALDRIWRAEHLPAEHPPAESRRARALGGDCTVGCRLFYLSYEQRYVGNIGDVQECEKSCRENMII